MKKIEALIRPFKLDEVSDALKGAGVSWLTVSDVRDLNNLGRGEVPAGSEYVVDFLPKVKIEMTVEDGKVEEALKALTEAARTGKEGDGYVSVADLLRVTKI